MGVSDSPGGWGPIGVKWRQGLRGTVPGRGEVVEAAVGAHLPKTRHPDSGSRWRRGDPCRHIARGNSPVARELRRGCCDSEEALKSYDRRARQGLAKVRLTEG